MSTAVTPQGGKRELTVTKHAVCTFCGCVCDDIELHAEGEKIVETKRACSLGESWFKNHTAERLYPDALIDGKLGQIIQKARLRAARSQGERQGRGGIKKPDRFHRIVRLKLCSVPQLNVV